MSCHAPLLERLFSRRGGPVSLEPALGLLRNGEFQPPRFDQRKQVSLAEVLPVGNPRLTLKFVAAPRPSGRF